MSNLEKLERLRSSLLTSHNSSGLPVSPIIHQIYLDFSRKEIRKINSSPPVQRTNLIPEKWKSSKQAWIDHHPSCSYILWDDDMLDELMKRFYPEFLDMYYEYPYPIQRVDTGRTFILHRYGGVYSDLDLEPKTNLWNLFSGREDVYLVQDSGRYTNMLMGSPINSCFWPKLWEEFRHPTIAWWANMHHFYIQTTTGPLALDRVAKSYHRTIGLLPDRYIQPCTACQPRPCTKDDAFFIMLQGGSWNKLDTICVEMFACHWLEILIILSIIIISLILFYWLKRSSDRR